MHLPKGIVTHISPPHTVAEEIKAKRRSSGITTETSLELFKPLPPPPDPPKHQDPPPPPASSQLPAMLSSECKWREDGEEGAEHAGMTTWRDLHFHWREPKHVPVQEVGAGFLTSRMSHRYKYIINAMHANRATPNTHTHTHTHTHTISLSFTRTRACTHSRTNTHTCTPSAYTRR